ncbi:hypothetical protein EJ02DRAFT_422516 [Clathrospora elynae]|uniref:Uncharacterized protein n=1 Tax=Clathrospora elynae TaxID=706981 RepID=A0A6A5SQQ7_9PLEO|nr:hypothetical protein EJ02DRAFT_422516 [Clathrospora elynae]
MVTKEKYRWDSINTISLSWRTLLVVVRSLPNLGSAVGTAQFPDCAVVPESMLMPSVTFERVELIIFEPILKYRETGMTKLKGVMAMYAMMQEGLDSAAIAFTGFIAGDEGVAIRSWTSGGSNKQGYAWHIEVKKMGRVGVERSVEYTGLQPWTDVCDVCDVGPADVESYHLCRTRHCGGADAVRFTRISTIEEGAPAFFCEKAKEATRMVDGELELLQDG